jgi:Ala-tRNA(Pro) deacylase
MTERATGPPTSAYDRLIEMLERGNAEYRLIDHQPDGRTEVVSVIRGHDLSQAAKCIVVMVKLGKKTT